MVACVPGRKRGTEAGVAQGSAGHQGVGDEVARRALEHLQRLPLLAALQQDAAELAPCQGLRGVELEGPAESILVVGRGQIVRLRGNQ